MRTPVQGSVDGGVSASFRDMLSASLLVAALAAFSAGILSGVTGFGLAVIVVPLLLLVYDPKTVVALTGCSR